MRYGVVTFSGKSKQPKKRLIWFKRGSKSTQYKNKWAYGIFEEWQRQRLVKVPIVEVVGLFKNYDYHHVESLETPLVEMSVLSVNYWLTKLFARGRKALKRTLPSENLVRHCCWYSSLARREETG